MAKPSSLGAGQRARLRLVDPAIGQGRPHHNPERDLDIVLTILLVVGPVFVVIGGIALVCAALAP